MWQNFTERGKRVFQLAHSEALRLGHEVIGTEHILLGLLDDADGIVTQILSNYNLHPEVLKAEIESLVGTGRPRSQPVDLPSSPSQACDRSFHEGSQEDGRQLHRDRTHTSGHTCRRKGWPQLLASHGMDLPRTRMMVRSILSGNQADPELDPMKSDSAPQALKPCAEQNSTLDQIGIDLTMMARNSELDPVIGRDKEIQRVVQILSRRTKNNPVLIGEPGVGKTAIAEGLAQRIVSGEIPEILKDKRVMQLNVANLVAGTKYRGEFEERMRKIVKEVREAKKVILFIDEIHTLVGAGGAEGAVDAANIIKPSLSRGEFQVIGATTITEYRKYIEKDAALERRFQPVHVEEPSEEDTVSILKGLRDSYEAHHRVKITDDALEAAAKLSQRYITDRFLPDKAIDLIDEACEGQDTDARSPEDLKALERSVREIRREKEAAVGSQEFEKAADLRDQERSLSPRSRNGVRAGQSRGTSSPPTSRRRTSRRSSLNGPASPSPSSPKESRRLLRMEDEIKQRLVGQDEAIHAVARAIRRSRAA